MNWLPVRIAFRHLASRKSHTAVGVISIVAICAVAVTTMAMLCVLSVFNGFRGLVDSKLSMLEPDIKISAARGYSIGNADSLARIIEHVHGIAAIAPTVTDNALALYANRQIPVTLKGIPDNYGEITDLPRLVQKGGTYRLTSGDDNFCIMSIGAASALGAMPGGERTCSFYAPRRIGAINIANPASAFRKVPAFVAGVFEIKQGEYDQNHVYVSLDAAQRLFGCIGEATALEVKLADGANEQETMSALREKLGPDYKVENRLMQHALSLRMINIEKWIAFLLLGLILIVASFNVISTLAILIMEKQSNISTLRALGADNRTTDSIFVVEGWLVSLIGALAGIALGVVLCLLQIHFGLVRLSADTSNLIVDAYPVAISATDMLAIFAIVAVVGLAASLATVRAMRGYMRKAANRM